MKTQPLIVEDLMSTALITVRPRTPLAEAEELMRNADVRHLPVVDDHQHVIGILSHRNLRGHPNHRSARTVSEVMVTRVHTVRPDSPAHLAAALMIEHKIGSLPVVAEDSLLVGIITETDFLAVAHQALRGLPIGRAQE